MSIGASNMQVPGLHGTNARRLANVKSGIESTAIGRAEPRDDSTLLRAWH